MLEGLMDAMRDSAERTFSDSILVRQRNRTKSSTGGSVYTYSDVETVTGRLMAVSNREAEYAAKQGISASHVAILPWDAEVRVEDVLVVGGVEYAISGVQSHEEPAVKRVWCARVES
jgi:SPP1 family predicted phage head-tail adaptor